ncbi:DUF4232 domain-containing protein [Streptomyces sp. NPDC051211]|uniref:DUF4232 domain-containing protein n=1 Tax=Streptomyces sp. NPDC051211 TaxID=3154643 RepID=UPI00344BA8AD
MRTARRSLSTCVLGAAALAALFSATACSSNDSDRGEGTGSSAGPGATGSAAPGGGGSALSGSPSAGASPAPGGGGTTVPGPAGSASPGGSGNSGGSGSGGQAATAACTDANVSITGSFERQDSGQNLFLTAVNTGDEPCTLYYYPLVDFGVATDVPPPPMESPARALATIKPGERAYAGLRLFRAGEQTDAVTSVKIAFHSRVANTETGRPAAVALPDRFVNIDSKPLVTFWNRDADAVKSYTFKAR